MNPPDEEIDSADALDAALGPAASAAAPDAGRKEEIDIWWGGYASRTMLPSFIVCVVVTGLIVLGVVLLVYSYDLKAADGRVAIYVLAGGLWIIQTLRWLYRVTGYTYRLTSRRVYTFWGFLLPKPAPVELVSLDEVVVEQTAVERLLNVGRIRLEQAGRSPTVVLLGIFDPSHVADDIDRCLRTSQGQASEA